MLLAAPAAAAQEAPAEELEPREESFRPNELALVFASTYEAEGGGNFFTVGLEYERRFTPWFGISGTYEYVTDVGASVFAFPVTLRVWRALKLLAGPGFEHVTRRAADEGEDGLEEGEGGDNLFLVRVGAQYAFELGERFSIVPGIELDLVDESEGVAKALVYGVNFAIAF